MASARAAWAQNRLSIGACSPPNQPPGIAAQVAIHIARSLGVKAAGGAMRAATARISSGATAMLAVDLRPLVPMVQVPSCFDLPTFGYGRREQNRKDLLPPGNLLFLCDIVTLPQ